MRTERILALFVLELQELGLEILDLGLGTLELGLEIIDMLLRTRLGQ